MQSQSVPNPKVERAKNVLKETVGELAIPAAIVGTGAIVLALYEAVNLNNLSTDQQQIVDNLINFTANNASSIAEAAQNLKNSLFDASQAEGITSAALLALLAIPMTVKSFGHRAAKNAAIGWMKYASDNWDYVLGRAVQVGSVVTYAEGFIQKGAKEIQLATGLLCAAPIVAFAGTLFIKHSASKHAEVKNGGNGVFAQFREDKGPGEAGEGLSSVPPLSSVSTYSN